MNKIKLGPRPVIYPIPMVLVGANVHGRANFELVGDCGLMGIKPALVCISSSKGNHTNIGILENGNFSLNFPTTAMMAAADYCGTVSGREVDKSGIFEVFYGELGTAPLIAECPVNLECRVLKEFSIQHRQMFVAEVVQAHVSEPFVHEQDGRYRLADLTELDPLIYALDNRYYSIGEPIGTGYQEGSKFKPA